MAGRNLWLVLLITIQFSLVLCDVDDPWNEFHDVVRTVGDSVNPARPIADAIETTTIIIIVGCVAGFLILAVCCVCCCKYCCCRRRGNNVIVNMHAGDTVVSPQHPGVYPATIPLQNSSPFPHGAYAPVSTTVPANTAQVPGFTNPATDASASKLIEFHNPLIDPPPYGAPAPPNY